jgi:hypothetical protein
MFARHYLSSRLAGIFLFLGLVVLRVMAWADANQVWLFGRQLNWGCWFREHYGFPCPTCGMTRSVILTVHGDFNNAFLLNPAGPFLIAGLLVVILIALRLPLAGLKEIKSRQLALGLSLYGWIFVCVMLGQWTFKLR